MAYSPSQPCYSINHPLPPSEFFFLDLRLKSDCMLATACLKYISADLFRNHYGYTVFIHSCIRNTQ